MNILIVKLSSMGDIIHTFPAVMDAKKCVNDLTIDWLVDESFADVVQLQQATVDNIISIPLRNAKQHLGFSSLSIIRKIFSRVRKQQYDVVIDAQGLLKSAVLAKCIKAKTIIGLDRQSARESWASVLYHKKISIDRDLHAIHRTRQLFAEGLNYSMPGSIEYGLTSNQFKPLLYLQANKIDKYVVFLHGTTWESKEWSLEYWQQLSELCIKQGIQVVIMTCGHKERQRMQQLLVNNPQVICLANLKIAEVAAVLAYAQAVVSVDTGLGHLAAGLGLKVIGLYGPTSAVRAGMFGNNCTNIQAKYHCSPCFSRECLEYLRGQSVIKQPCFLEITPKLVMSQLLNAII